MFLICLCPENNQNSLHSIGRRQEIAKACVVVSRHNFFSFLVFFAPRTICTSARGEAKGVGCLRLILRPPTQKRSRALPRPNRFPQISPSFRFCHHLSFFLTTKVHRSMTVLCRSPRRLLPHQSPHQDPSGVPKGHCGAGASQRGLLRLRHRRCQPSVSRTAGPARPPTPCKHARGGDVWEK